MPIRGLTRGTATLIAAGALVGLGAPPAALAGDGTFTSAADVAVGARPASVALGDFNNDGKQDLAAANLISNPATVSVRLGTGTGTFTNVAHVGVGFSPRSVAVGDFNSDGNEDIAIACNDVLAINEMDHVYVRLGAGNGTFTNAANVTVGRNPYGVAVGDLNGDGNADLATANNDSANVTVHLGTGTGAFNPTSDAYTVNNTQPRAVAVGDFSSDGIQDLAIAADPSSVAVRIGQGNGTFVPHADVAVGVGPSSLAVADFNGDAREDLVVANNGDDDASVRLGAGNGTFAPTVDVPIGDAPNSVAAGDLNSDGREDFAMVHGAGSNPNADMSVKVRLGAGDGSFTNAPNVPATKVPFSIAAGDLDSDGNDDLAVAGQLDGPIFIRLGAGAPALAGNLLANGGFEGPGAGRLLTQAPAIPGWQRTGGISFARYGIPPQWGFLSRLEAPRYRTGGSSFLWGGNSAATGGTTTAFQTVDVAGSAASIDAALATVNLSAFLGGGAHYDDRMKVTADFLNAAGEALGKAEIGPVTAAERRNVTGLLPRARTAKVPVGTRRIRVTVTATDPDATYSGGMADNVKLTLDAPKPPPAGGPGGATAAGFGQSTRVTLALASKRIPAKGPVPVRVRNRNIFRVTGSLSGQTAKGKRVKLKSRRFAVRANRSTTVRLKLPKRLRRALQRSGKLALRVTARVKDPTGRTRIVRKRVSPKLKAKRRGRR